MEQYISKSVLVAEIERLVNNYDKALDYEAALEDVRNFIDSLEVKEPQVKESAEFQHVNETCKENGNSLTQEPAINVWHDMSEDAENDRNIIIIDPKGFYGAVLRKGGYQRRNHNKERYVKWAYIEDLLNLSNVQRTGKNWNEPVSEELEEASLRASIIRGQYIPKEYLDEYPYDAYAQSMFKRGAKWQAEQFEKNRLAACDRQAEEEAEIERDFVIGIIENEHRQPTYDDAIKYGMRLQKEQMMTKSIKAVVSQVPCSNEIIFYNPSSVYEYCLPQEMNKLGLYKGDKVKLIIIKED